ncbi:hypothetical protein GCM10010123_41610 [Pilimelia anulata]|uniref:Uncharacterized protein n=1 Tax=Pilimelia anulata TaxID=53371 RepID=A0A8J3FCR3_9ACTN|nr:hypothetical protein [Pilimelia anulata]GGK07390.1 hypothetical protein GCM10010123_41610 [Pilimelia anulata]
MHASSRAAVALAATALGALPLPPPAAARGLDLPFLPQSPGRGLVTNEWATYNARLSAAHVSPDWEMTSGSLFAMDSPYGPAFASGRVDDREPDPDSRAGTNSAIFRMVSRRADFDDATVRLKIRVDEQDSTRSTPRTDWDGVHLWLRHQSETSTYYASLLRRDGRLVIKKKCPGGPSNGGRYHELSEEVPGYPILPHAWKRFTVTIRTNASGSVAIAVYRLGRLVVRAVDDGVGCAPITAPGRVGLRGDNTEFAFAAFAVDPTTTTPTTD